MRPARQLRPEAELLLACSRTRLSGETRERIRCLARGNLDWASVRQLAHRHGVFPLLYRQLSAAAQELVPPAELKSLRAKFLDNAARNVLLTSELEQLVGRFESAGLPVLAYKGPALAALAYGDTALRRYVDLDVIVRRADVGRAKSLLAERGLRPHLALPPAQERVLLRAQHNMQFTRDEGRVLVELHWEVASRKFASAQLEGGVWERAVPVRLGRGEVKSLSPEDLLSSLCVHGARHLWERLSWICDVAELLGSRPRLDWDYVFGRARAERTERMLLLGLLLAGGQLGAEMPGEIRRRATADETAAALAECVSRRLFERDEYGRAGIAESVGFNLRARERWGEKLRYLGFIFTPTDADLALVRLPAGLSFAYYLVRPFRLLLGSGKEH
ncbi:MAG TPA: nucleotidyltransferase family protein [Pyrinomonadaceae bacterium]|nr:nucleotidyltransferase family protein [Pyrinomonadaceae bacterium]